LEALDNPNAPTLAALCLAPGVVRR
jgi:hypothetical protein